MKLKISHIYWFAHYNMLGPCTRYRGKYVLDEINRAHNIPSNFVYPSYQLRQFSKFFITYLSALLFRKRNSVIVFQKTYTIGIYSSLLKILLRLRNKNTYYDIDDAYYVKFPPDTIQYFIKHSQVCVTGSSSLTNYSRELLSDISKVFTLSSPILKQNNLEFRTNKIFSIGWAGFYNYHRNSLLEYLFPALTHIQFRCNLILLGIVKEDHFEEISEYFTPYPNINIIMPRNIDWTDEVAFYNLIKEFDVGVSPLLDNEINRAKSAFKLKQYLCCGIPVVGSDTGENSKVIKHGINGFVANNELEFYNRLLQVKEMGTDERKIFYKNAIDSVKEYEMKKYCQEFIEVIETTMK